MNNHAPWNIKRSRALQAGLVNPPSGKIEVWCRPLKVVCRFIPFLLMAMNGSSGSFHGKRWYFLPNEDWVRARHRYWMGLFVLPRMQWIFPLHLVHTFIHVEMNYFLAVEYSKFRPLWMETVYFLYMLYTSKPGKSVHFSRNGQNVRFHRRCIIIVDQEW